MNVPLILTDFLDRAVALYGEKKAIFTEDRVFTYAELNERVNRLSHGLHKLGVRKGDRVAYLAPNSVEMLEGFYGVFQLRCNRSVEYPFKIGRLCVHIKSQESKVLFVDQNLYHLD